MKASSRTGAASAGPEQIVLSASRRTDIPAFYMSWFMAGIHRGEFAVTNPFNRRVTRVAADPARVHTIVFWSKDYGPFLRDGYGRQLRESGYHLFFHYTLNSTDPLLEPNLPPLDRRLGHLESLCAQFGPQAVNWRFDPICHFRHRGEEIRDNLAGFARIADAAAQAGVKRCTASFMDLYPKIDRRAARIPGFEFADPGPEAKRRLLLRIEGELAGRGIRLFTCCERELIERLPEGHRIEAGACIPSELLMTLYGGRLSTRVDSGQRRRAGCRCRVSVDIGSYERHPCRHNCLYCYASPAGGTRPPWN